jgi:hypothetical protein
MIPDFLDGAVDLHVHSSPDVDPRRYDDLDLSREAARAGMAAILIKNHQFSTVERAALVSRVVEGVSVFGGLVLNAPVGGINPAAVRIALQLGARQIWMPTRSARNHLGNIALADHWPEVREILGMLAGSDCILGTGHLSPEEGTQLLTAAREAGVTRLLVTHPEWSRTEYPIALQKELAAQGVMFERCFVSTTHRCGYTPWRVIEDAIGEAGAAATILSTDLGQPDTPPPAEGLRLYAERLRATGFSADDIHTMIASNPARLLSLTSRRGTSRS